MNRTDSVILFRLVFLGMAAFLILFSCSPQKRTPESATEKQTLRRSDSYFGLHFDFHANKNDSAIGKTFTAEMIDSLLTMVQPDYIQVDCKGHPGISSYPTKVGNAERSAENLARSYPEAPRGLVCPLFRGLG